MKNKKNIEHIFKDVINKTEFKLVDSKKLNKKTLDLNFSNISLANYSVMERYNKNIDLTEKKYFIIFYSLTPFYNYKLFLKIYFL